MSLGSLDGEGDGGTVEAFPEQFDQRLKPGEEVYLLWDATGVHWADEWAIDLGSSTTFAATDRRIIFESGDSTTSIGYEHVRAVKTEPPSGGPGLHTASLVSGSIGLLVGLLVTLRDFANGFGLMILSFAVLVVGLVTERSANRATITLVIDNERQRISFSADESVGAELARLAERDVSVGEFDVSAGKLVR